MPNYLKGAKGSKLLVLISNDDADPGPETFDHPCTINADREFALETTFSEEVQIDCDDPEAPGWQELTPDVKSGTITGSGRLNTPDYDAWFDWWDSGAAKTCKVALDVAAADGGVIVTGGFVLANLSMSGARGGSMQGAVTLRSSGPLVKTAAAI